MKDINTSVESSVYRMQNSKIQKMMSKDKENFTVEQCKIVEANRLANSTKDLYQGVRNITKKLKPANDTVKEEDGTIVYDGEDIKRGRKNTVQKFTPKEILSTLYFMHPSKHQ